MITKFTETMILPAVPDFVEDFDISYIIRKLIMDPQTIFMVIGTVMTPIAVKLA